MSHTATTKSRATKKIKKIPRI